MGLKDRFRLGKTETVISASGVDHDHDGSNPTAELRNFRKQHKWDPFLDNEKLDTIDSAIDSENIEKAQAVDVTLIQDDSPYAEVRAAVPPTDDPDMPVDTLRAWMIGGVLCTVVAAINVLLQMRTTPISITSTVVQLVSYP